ncbi:MAG TPA: alpha-amylase family glycosyl hydrolase, partial [Methylomirabilota bacterium]
DAGGGFVGGALRGLHGKLGYLRRLGVTAIWISPVLKQVAFREPYHGYGIQDFLGVDPQFLRPVSGNGRDFGIPESVGGRLRSIVPWSRIFDDREVLLAINTDPREARTAWVTVDDAGHRAGDRLRCLYSTDAAQLGKDVAVEPRNGKAVRLEVEPGGFVAYGR